MPSPFPGMNPYLENPQLWPEVHNRLIVAISDVLVPQLLPKYRVALEKRVYQSDGDNAILIGIPDVTVQRLPSQTTSPTSNVAVAAPLTKPLQVTVPMQMEFREGYLEVREIATKEVVTVIEVLSPTNKRTGQGREIYEEKRQQVLASRTHLVEIDLLRAGQPMPVFGNNIQGSYRILVSRGNRRPRAELYIFNLPDEIPAFPLPLRTGDVEPVVDLQALIGGVYDRSGYDFVIDYSGEPVPPLSEADAAWANALLREKELR